MNIVFVGAGRLATQFARALQEKGHTIDAVYSRTMESARALCTLVGAVPTDNIDDLPLKADAFVLAVKDSVLPELAARLSKGREGQMFFHTAGSIPMSVFGAHRHHGVIYPMQTFSKEREVDFSHLPLFVESSTLEALQTAMWLARSVSDQVIELSSQERRYLHLAAVFACNFTNHCYALSAQVLEKHGIAFETMLPLIAETARKVETMHPFDAQTGPAVRFDENVMNAHLQLLADELDMQEVYEVMSRSIHNMHQTKENIS